MSDPAEDIAIQCLKEKDIEIARLKAIIASLRLQLATKTVKKKDWQEQRDYLDYEEDR